MGGMLNLTGFKENDPVKVGPSVADHVAGIYLMVGVGMGSVSQRKNWRRTAHRCIDVRRNLQLTGKRYR